MGYELFLAFIPSLITGVMLAIFGQKMQKLDIKRDALEFRRRKEAKLSLDLTFATAQLSYASAMALKRGHPNGEVEQGISAYEVALAAYRKFEREQVVDSLEG